MYILVLYLPLISAIIVGFCGRYLGRQGAFIFSTLSIGLTLCVAIYIFYEVSLCGVSCNIKLLEWFGSGLLCSSLGLLFDTITSIMLIVVTFVSFLVHMYSGSYMSEDPHLVRFMSYLSIFTFFMLCLITADNFILLFLGWEGVGVASYLLINFWFTRIQANKSAIKAVIVNRFGDFGLSLAIFLIYYLCKSLDFGVVFAIISLFKDYNMVILNFEINIITVISLLLFIGTIGKSAQLGLHTWLPDAMEGPTPVSALIHAATMVTAGVFLIIRCSPIIDNSNSSLIIISFFGAMTAFFAGIVGIFQNDLKRVIAYSTCSQLGYMVFVCGLSNYNVGMFHLMNHAFFKALLFLSAGSVIHALMDEQDMRRMGGLIKILPYTFVMFFIGSVALMGFPFTTGYYSKDVILELAYASWYVEGYFSYVLGVLAAFCTAFYSFRLIYLTFLAETNSYKRVIEHAHDVPTLMFIPLFVLCIGSIFFGYIFKDMFIGFGTNFWGNSLGFIKKEILILEAEFLHVFIKLLPVLISLLGGILALVLYHYFCNIFYYVANNNVLRSIYIYFNKKWLFDIVYNYFIVHKTLSVGYHVTFKVIDRGIIEIFGPTGIVRLFLNVSELISKFQTGFLYHYVFIMILGLSVCIILILNVTIFYSLFLFIIYGIFLLYDSNYDIT